MFSNVILFSVPWHQHGWNGTICASPRDNAGYCQKAENNHLIQMCEIMAGREHLDRMAITENHIRRGLQNKIISRTFTGKKGNTPVIDFSSTPDPQFGRLSQATGRWEPLATVLSCPHLRPDPWCANSLATFKAKATRHGLANQYTDDCCTFAGKDFDKVLRSWPASWQSDSGKVVTPQKPLYALICCKTSPIPTTDQNAILVVGAIKISHVRNAGNLWHFKGERAVRLPLQELLEIYERYPHGCQQRNEISEIFDGVPTVRALRGLFAFSVPHESQRLFQAIQATSAKIDLWLTDNRQDISFAIEHLAAEAQALLDEHNEAPAFKYPNLGQVLGYIRGKNKTTVKDKARDTQQAQQEHAEAYFNDKECDIKKTLDLAVDSIQLNDQQKDFFKSYLVYYDIDATYMDSLEKLFTENYSCYWDVIQRRGTEFAGQVLQNPYVLSEEVTVKQWEEPKTPKRNEEEDYFRGDRLRIAFRCIDAGEHLRRKESEPPWLPDQDAGRIRALQYDLAFINEKEDDWARVRSDLVHPELQDPTENSLLQSVLEDQLQRHVVQKAHCIIEEFFSQKAVQVSHQNGNEINNEDMDAQQLKISSGFESFFKDFPEHKNGTEWGEFLKTKKGEKVGQAIEEQFHGIKEILTNRFTIITGKAGAGKSEMFKTVVEKLKDTEDFLFLAPTGKAVQAIQEKVGEMVSERNFLTIAKFLLIAKAQTDVFEPASGESLKGFAVTDAQGNSQKIIEINDKKPLNIIIDEASMIDIIAMANLCHTLKELWNNPQIIKRFVLVGDINQLPPVQSGFPFRQLLNRFEQIVKEQSIPNPQKVFGFCRLDVSLRFIKGEKENLALTQYADSFTPGANKADLPEGIAGTIKLQQGTENFYFGTFSDRDTLEACIDAVFALQLNFEKSGDLYKIVWGGGGGNITVPKKTVKEALELNMNQLEKSLKATQTDPEILKKTADSAFLSMFQVITPTKKNYFGVTELGAMLREKYPPSQLKKYIQTQNDQKQKVFNGNLAVKHTKWSENQMKEWLYYPDSGQKLEAEKILQSNKAEPAYAITVHKSQGSGFSITVAVLPESIHEGLRSAQMQYTAVTRTKDICILLKEVAG